MLSELSRKISQSPTLAISAKAKQMKKEGKDVISFGAGEPDFDTPDFIKESAVNALRSGDTKYTPASGTLELKQAIVKKLKRVNNLIYTTDEIMINCGAKHSLFNVILCVARTRDEIIVPSPYWVSYPEMIKIAGATIVVADCLEQENFKLTPEILKEYITKRSRFIILNSPSNPTGTLYSAEELQALGEVILKHNLYVISDEIYEYIVYKEQFNSIAQISKELKKRTIIVNGLSKAYSMTGWRIGYIAANSEVISACSKLQSHSTSNPTSFAQAGAVTALNSPKGTEAIAAMVKEFKKRRDFVYNELNSIPRITVSKPQGAFYIFPCIKQYLNERVKTAHQFAEELLEKSLVAVIPGEGFGAPGYIRISYATSMENLREGITRIKKFLRHL
ncbi:pyridoxal phosphate-dependent aminotransferase [Elusimicrobiota bacterium]